MSSSLRRGALAAAAIAFSIASLAACGAGSNAQTLGVKPDNAATSVGTIKIQNATVITQPDLQSTGPAVISATIFNNGRTPQTLDAITVADTNKAATISPAKGTGKLTVPAGGSVVIGGKGNASAVLDNSSEAVQDGNAQKVTFSFSSTGDVSLRAFVVPAESYFSKWGPSDIPAAPGASATTKPSGSASGSPSESASGKPTDAASSSATATATATDTATASAGH
ncbi:hypothetical protein [Streptomyces sp. 142MFCol3.1]|uniref:hypothetical protein n=1 Tax=Streptomyces sp. 142MFCol3.1 TaxID=1172179 RepID=UPI00041BECAB|nr:hypothetical protein [Streptomyces sp. 142MFCol3.1]